MMIETFIRAATERLTARDPAANRRLLRDLVAFRLGREANTWITRPKMEIPRDVEAQLWRDVAAIESGIPLGYVYGWVSFLDWDFLTDARAMCPRVETEELCHRLITRLRVGRQPGRILDLGCGSGVLGLSLALAFPQSQVLLCDCDTRSLDLARENCSQLGLSDRVTLLCTDWWLGLESFGDFDVIVSNPPYVADNDHVEPGVLAHEPHAALFAGRHGLDAIRLILKPLANRLRAHGLAAFELGPKAKRHLQVYLKELGFSGRWTWEVDPFGVPRFLFYSQ